MSDDEYEFDDDFEYFFIEEPEPTAADDLAATAHNDALFFDDPALDVEDFFSDWDELSDDYYDDDPTAVRRLRATGNWPNKENNTKSKEDQDQDQAEPQSQPPPAKKQKASPRKANTTATQPTPFQPDIKSFQSVVWRSPADEKKKKKNVSLYQPGDGEQVALLKNWREVFRAANPSLERLRGRNGHAGAGAGAGAGTVEARASGRKRRASGSEVDGDAGASASVQSSPPPLVHSAKKGGSGGPVKSTTDHELPVNGNEAIDGMDVHEAEKVNGVGESDNKKAEPARSTRNRKRKAPDSHDPPEQNEETQDVGAGRKSKRMAASKPGQQTAEPQEQTGPTRRSARQRK